MIDNNSEESDLEYIQENTINLLNYKKIGNIMIDNNYISINTLNLALNIQKHDLKYLLIGELLILKNVISQKTLEKSIDIQKNQINLIRRNLNVKLINSVTKNTESVTNKYANSL